MDQVSLLDWVYPAERSYQVLQRSVQAAGRQGWLVQRMQDGKALPQASARELALDLADDPAVSPQDKDELKQAFQPETDGLQREATGDTRTANLERDFAKMNKRMAELEATLKVNHYNAQTFPGFSFTLSGQISSKGGSGLFTGSNRTSNMSIATLNFNGGTWGFNLAAQNDFMNRNGWLGVGGQGFVTAGPGIIVKLGQGDGFYGGTLALAGKSFPDAGNDFALSFDYKFDTTPTFTTSDLKLGLPSGTYYLDPLIIVSKSGESAYWPLSAFTVFWGPDTSFYKGWDTLRNNQWGMLGRMDAGRLWGLADRNTIYGVFTGSGNDLEQRRTFGLMSNTASSWTSAVGSETNFSWGGQLFAEFGVNNSVGSNPDYVFPAGSTHLIGYKPGVTYRGYSWDWNDQAYVVAYTQPIGFMTFGIEGSHVGPLFTPRLGAVSWELVNGVDNNVATNPSTMTPWRNPPTPDGTVDGTTVVKSGTRHMAWGTNVTNATGLMTNTEKLVLQMQASFAWLSIGLFGGTAAQINPTGPWIKTNPSFEAGRVGWLLWDNLGFTYAPPPAPFSVVSGSGSGYRLGKFNQPTEGKAIYNNAGQTYNAHFQGLSAIGYQDVSLYLLMTKNGLGDARLIEDGFKYVNYAAANIRVDMQTLLSRPLPFTIRFSGEQRDVAPQAGLPTFGDPAKPGDPSMSYFTQSVGSVFVRYGFNSILSILGLYGAETWRSDHTYFPLLVSIHEYGIGADFDLARYLTGLGVFTRSRIYYLEDSFYSQRDFVAWEALLGTTIAY